MVRGFVGVRGTFLTLTTWPMPTAVGSTSPRLLDTRASSSLTTTIGMNARGLERQAERESVSVGSSAGTAMHRPGFVARAAVLVSTAWASEPGCQLF